MAVDAPAFANGRAAGVTTRRGCGRSAGRLLSLTVRRGGGEAKQRGSDVREESDVCRRPSTALGLIGRTTAYSNTAAADWLTQCSVSTPVAGCTAVNTLPLATKRTAACARFTCVAPCEAAGGSA